MRWIAACLVVCLLAFAPEANAYSEQERARQAYERGEIKSLAEIMRSVRQQVRGRIISTQFRATNGGRTVYIYTFGVLSDDGNLVKIDVDASNSVVIQVRGQSANGAGRP